jgi:Flp pilus assembly pilin Flp
MMQNLLKDECGAIISAELVLVLTIAVLAMVVGLSELAVAVNTELNDVSNAIGALNQSYAFRGFIGVGTGADTKVKSFTFGSRFQDSEDSCDKNESCDLIGGNPAVCSEGATGTVLTP